MPRKLGYRKENPKIKICVTIDTAIYDYIKKNQTNVSKYVNEILTNEITR